LARGPDGIHLDLQRAVGEVAGQIIGFHINFIHNTIRDVILYLRFTGRDGGQALRQKAFEHIEQLVKHAQASGMGCLFSSHYESPGEWAAYKATPVVDGFRPLKIRLTPHHYPFWSRVLRKIDVKP